MKTDLSYRLARAVADGRKQRGRPANRETVLLRLLEKRAAAHRAGLLDLEKIMRNQVQWSLPMIDSESAMEPGSAVRSKELATLHLRHLSNKECCPS